jgi:hypothetical protein
MPAAKRQRAQQPLTRAQLLQRLGEEAPQHPRETSGPHGDACGERGRETMSGNTVLAVPAGGDRRAEGAAQRSSTAGFMNRLQLLTHLRAGGALPPGAAVVSTLPAGLGLRRDQDGAQGAAASGAEGELPGAKRQRAAPAQTRAQLLRSLVGDMPQQPRESSDEGVAGRGDARPAGSPSQDATTLLRSARRPLECGAPTASAATVTTRPQTPASLRAAGGRSLHANSSSAREHRAAAGDAQLPAPPAIAHHAAGPGYTSSDPRATRPA